MAIALGRVVTTQVKGSLNAVVANLTMLEETWDDPEAETSNNEPVYTSLGVYGRPLPGVEPGTGSGNDPDGHTEFLGLRLGDRVLPFGVQDLRLSAKVNPKEGEVGLVQYRGGFVSLKDNGDGDGTSIVIYAVRNDSSGVPDKASAIQLDSTEASANISITHESGQTIGMVKTKKAIVISNAAGDAYIEVNDEGITLNGNTVISGGTGIGDSTGAAGEFLVKGTLFLAWFAELTTAINIMATKFNTAGTMVGAPGTVVPPTSVPIVTTLMKGV
jgi:hypothetical protein